jgi:hypothetical protein
MPAVIIIQPPSFPNEYPRGRAIRVFLPEVGQLSKTWIGGQLASGERINQSSISE